MTRPLVSVITPTWQRNELLLEAVENVRDQTYRPLEQVIVSDGPDDTLDFWFGVEDEHRWAEDGTESARWVPLRYVSLGRNWSTFLDSSFCAAPMTVGMLIATGSLQVWLADDERMTPDHIEGLVDALESSGADFAYGRVEMQRGGVSWPIGTDPPRLGEITNVLYRTDLLKHGLYPFGAGMTSDWACISRWMSRGAKHVFVDRLTLSHRADH